MHHGHWVICAMPSAISSLLFFGSAPSLNATLSKSRKARYASGTSSRIRLNCVPTSTPWNSIFNLLAPAECGLALLTPGAVSLGLVLGLLEHREAVEIDERGVRQVRDVESAHQRFLGQPRGQRRQRRSEEHTSELQSPCNLVCRLLLEKKKRSSIRHNVLSSHS